MKLVANLEHQTNNEDSDDIIDLVSALADPVRNCGLISSWAENWNLIIPSWREAVAIVLPTLLGAYCGLRYPIRDGFPVMMVHEAKLPAGVKEVKDLPCQQEDKNK